MHLHFFKALAFVVVVFAASAAAQCNCQGPNTACNLNSECCSNQCVNRGVSGFNCSTWHTSSVQPATLITASQSPESLLRPLGYIHELWTPGSFQKLCVSIFRDFEDGKSIFAIGRKLSFVRDTQNPIRRRPFPESNLVTVTVFQLSLDSSRLGASRDARQALARTLDADWPKIWLAPVRFGVGFGSLPEMNGVEIEMGGRAVEQDLLPDDQLGRQIATRRAQIIVVL
ncbi:hypothetical protein B0H14DRAFT_3163337 [Mycena olivaceomarginata]|nr:hypothetical protein B0H14DRAFT_3163337 [Mycena olivaceomarginata]